jgi:hypothetical protein
VVPKALHKRAALCRETMQFCASTTHLQQNIIHSAKLELAAAKIDLVQLQYATLAPFFSGAAPNPGPPEHGEGANLFRNIFKTIFLETPA